MKHSIRALFVLTALAAFGAAPASAQPNVIKGELQKDWADLKETMMKIADKMPDDKFSYKSTPAQRNYGEQIMHVATTNMALLAAVGGKATAPAINAKATSKAEILKALADSFDYGTALITEQTPESMLTPVNARFLGSSTRARIIYFLIGHTWDIYGQMAVYLRLNGLVPPASERP